jgi:hypothetical protein
MMKMKKFLIDGYHPSKLDTEAFDNLLAEDNVSIRIRKIHFGERNYYVYIFYDDYINMAQPKNGHLTRFEGLDLDSE